MPRAASLTANGKDESDFDIMDSDAAIMSTILLNTLSQDVASLEPVNEVVPTKSRRSDST